MVVVALSGGVFVLPVGAQPCAPGWSYYLDPVGPDRHVRSLAVHKGLLYARVVIDVLRGRDCPTIEENLLKA